MGFNKRFISKETILSTDEKLLNRLFSADALIMDGWSSDFHEYFKKGFDKTTILTMMEYGERTNKVGR